MDPEAQATLVDMKSDVLGNSEDLGGPRNIKKKVQVGPGGGGGPRTTR